MGKFVNLGTIDHGGIIVDALSASGLRAIRYSKEILDAKVLIFI